MTNKANTWPVIADRVGRLFYEWSSEWYRSAMAL